MYSILYDRFHDGTEIAKQFMAIAGFIFILIFCKMGVRFFCVLGFLRSTECFSKNHNPFSVKKKTDKTLVFYPRSSEMLAMTAKKNKHIKMSTK